LQVRHAAARVLSKPRVTHSAGFCQDTTPAAAVTQSYGQHATYFGFSEVTTPEVQDQAKDIGLNISNITAQWSYRLITSAVVQSQQPWTSHLWHRDHKLLDKALSIKACFFFFLKKSAKDGSALDCSISSTKKKAIKKEENLFLKRENIPWKVSRSSDGSISGVYPQLPKIVTFHFFLTTLVTLVKFFIEEKKIKTTDY
jgi:hypothetical protein